MSYQDCCDDKSLVLEFLSDLHLLLGVFFSDVNTVVRVPGANLETTNTYQK